VWRRPRPRESHAHDSSDFDKPYESDQSEEPHESYKPNQPDEFCDPSEPYESGGAGQYTVTAFCVGTG
jgi:hypothetical protein